MEEYPYPVLVEGDWSSINSRTLQSKVHIYFQSRKKSQGGDCVIKWSERSCKVFFKSEQIRNQVLSKAEHIIPIEQLVLKLKVYNPSSDSGSPREDASQTKAHTGSDVSAGAQQAVGLDASRSGGSGDTPLSNAVVLENVLENITKEFLILLVERICGDSEEEISLELIPELNAAVVTFNDPSAVQKFLTECEINKRFQESRLKARNLEESRSVKVENLPAQCLEDFLELYFEKHVGVVEKIKLVADEKVAIVTFQDRQAAQKVFEKKHMICDTKVDIYPYYLSLGSALYGKDRPTWNLPKQFIYEIHPAIREFLQKKGQISHICNEMSLCFCQVNMDKDKVLFSPLPALLRQKNITKKHIDNWAQHTMGTFKNILSTFGVFEHAVDPSVWTAVEKDIRSVVKDKAILKLDGSKRFLTLAGMAKDINVLKPILEKALQDASSQIEREKMKTSDTLMIQPAIFVLFEHEGLPKRARAKYPLVELTYRKDISQLSLTGLHVEIVDIKNEFLQKRLSLKQKTLEMDPSLLEFLKAMDSEEMSRDLFISKGFGAVCSLENGNIVLVANTDKDLTEAETRLKMMLTFQHISVDDLAVLKKKEWQELTNQLHETFSLPRKTTVFIKSSGGTVVVCGYQEPVREISMILGKFIETHSRIEETIRVRCYAVVKFIKENKAQVWQKFTDSDKLTIHFDSKRPLIRVSGERVHVQPALTKFKNIAESLQTCRHTITKAGAKKFFQEQGKRVLMMMIKDQRFVVVLEDASMEEDFEESYNNSTMKDDKMLSCEVRTPVGIVIKVLQADLCKLNVDAVVNAANEDLKHIGGLAFALLNAAGPSLQQSSDKYIAKHGKLQTGNAVTTEAGRLPCKYVVHAVGPRFNNTDQNTAVNKLRQAVRETLEQAVLYKLSSIALPAISSGIFGFPIPLCAETIAKGLHEYVDIQIRQGGMNTLKEILLVDNNSTNVNAMALAVKKEFKVFNPRMAFPQQMRSGQSLHGPKHQAQGAGRNSEYGAKAFDSQVYEAKESEEFDVLSLPYSKPQFKPQSMDRSGSGILGTQSTNEGLQIILRKGDLQDARSDVIVNTVSEDLDLSKGAVSKALLNAAGSQLQAEANLQLKMCNRSHFNYGDIVDTEGCNLSCERVFHAVCPFWSQGSSEKILSQIIDTCLRKAEKQKMASISFPAICTGNLKFPNDVVAKILLTEIYNFSASVSPKYLNKVAVIVHPSASETVQCFLKSFRGDWQGTVPKGVHAVQQSTARKQPAGSIGAVSSPSLGVHRMQIKHVTLEVSSGDITKERCDAIVNSSNQSFLLKTGVSKAILDAAGPAVMLECTTMALKSQQAEMIMTAGGLLPCQHIIHIVGRNRPADIKDVVFSVLKHCEEQQFSSVAFPALGTGQGGAQPSDVADAMIDALLEFVKKKKGVNLQSVKFLIFQAPMVSDFYQCMLKRQQESVEEEGGVIGWIKGKIDSVSSYFHGGKAEESGNEGFKFLREEIEPVVFQLCGETEEDLKEAKDLINSIIVAEQINSKIEDSTISCFGEEESDMLFKMQRELTVSIQLITTGPEPALVIEGLTRDVVEAGVQIREMIRKMEKKLTRQRNAFKVGKEVVWHYQDHSKKLVPFDFLTNYDLEEAFIYKQANISIKINNDTYETDLEKMIATGKHGPIELKRTDLKDKNVSLPSHWEDKKKTVELKQGSQEYREVETEFRKTGLTSTILKIERIQNETLWKNYMNQKEYLEKKNKHTKNEKRLFHGTSSDNIKKINERGFNRSYAGMHGAMYGNGVYFAVDPSYSANGYAKPDQQGHKRMYLARVLVGDFTTGKQGLLTPPDKNTSGTEQYDSVSDNGQTMFVIFHDDFAYPEYLITFK